MKDKTKERKREESKAESESERESKHLGLESQRAFVENKILSL